MSREVPWYASMHACHLVNIKWGETLQKHQKKSEQMELSRVTLYLCFTDEALIINAHGLICFHHVTQSQFHSFEYKYQYLGNNRKSELNTVQCFKTQATSLILMAKEHLMHYTAILQPLFMCERCLSLYRHFLKASFCAIRCSYKIFFFFATEPMQLCL